MNRFYPIVPSADHVAQFASYGAKLIQLRIKSGNVRDNIAAALTVPHIRLVINDHWQHAIDLGATDVHLGQEDLDEADIPAIRRAGIRIGISTHNLPELDRALSLTPDYIALGPIYPTTLKVMPWAPQGLDRITDWKRRIGAIPLVAIGGLTAERAPAVLAAGADCAAVVNDVVNAPDPAARTAAWLQATA